MAPNVKSNKKRSALSQPGPATKKPHLEKPHSKKSSATGVIKKRSQPVTAPLNDPETGSDSDGDVEEFAQRNEGDEDEPFDEDSIQVDPTPIMVAPKDPNASRESHKAQKVVQEQRRALKPHWSLLTEAKRNWSLVRAKNISASERQKHIDALMKVIRGKVKDIVFKHDASRIVQSVVKYGGQKERDEIAAELKGRYKDLAQNKYSKFLVTKLIRLCPTHRLSILLEFRNSVMRLLLHREASTMLADAFELYANAYERTILLRDFYGKEAALFTLTSGSEADKERAKKGLKGVLEGVDEERRRRTLGAVKENLVTIFNNPDKGAITHAVVHRALWEYLAALNDITDEAEQEKLRREMFETCQDAMAEMVHTKDGSRVVREFVAQGSAKDRKHIVKVLKPHVERMCIDDEAQLVLFSALDIIDDTKLTTKSLVPDITSHASTLYASPQGRRALIYLLDPRTRRHFTPAQIASLSETDSIRARTSKKDEGVRRDEVRKAASESLVKFVQEQGGEVGRDTGGSLLVSEIMLCADGDKSTAITTLLQALRSPYPSTDLNLPHPVDLPHTSRMYKTLLQGGHFSHASKTVEPVPTSTFSASAFAKAFVEIVGKETTLAIAKGNGAFMVAELCQRLKEEGGENEKRVFKGWFDKKVRKEIDEGDAKGKKVLLQNLEFLTQS